MINEITLHARREDDGELTGARLHLKAAPDGCGLIPFIDVDGTRGTWMVQSNFNTETNHWPTFTAAVGAATLELLEFAEANADSLESPINAEAAA